MNIENRNIRFTSTVICRIFLGICCCFLAACSSQSSQNNSNIFLYAVDFSHSTLSPGNVKFDMSMEDVLQKTQLSEDDVDTTLGEAYPRIIHSISISSLSDDIQEIFSFQNDQLVSVEYAITFRNLNFKRYCRRWLIRRQNYLKICWWERIRFLRERRQGGKMSRKTV